MLHLSSHGSRAVRSSSQHVCNSCRAVLRGRRPAWQPLSLPPGQARLITTETPTDRASKDETSKPEASKPAPPAKAPRTRSRNRSRSKSSPAESKQLLLWQQTLDVLKDMQASYEQAAADEETSSTQKKPKRGKGAKGKGADDTQDAKGETSAPAKKLPKVLKSHSKILAALGDTKGGTPESRAKLFAGALEVLKSVLASQAASVPNSEGSPEAQRTSKKANASSKTGRANSKPDGRIRRVLTSPSPELAAAAASAAAAAGGTAPVTKLTAEPARLLDSPTATIPPVGVSSPEAESLPPPSTPVSAPKKPPGPIEAKPGVFEVHKINSRELNLHPVEKVHPPVPRLAYGLDRALFNPGVYHMQDPRSRVFNFDPYLASIMPIQEFDFNALKQYVTSSKDNTLISMAAAYKKKYSGSTSSMTAMLSHFHYLLSSWRPIDPVFTSRSFSPDSYNYTRIMRSPAASFLHYRDGTYAIDADKEFDSANILSMLGKSMEKLLTLPKQEFERYRIDNNFDKLTEEEKNAEEAFHFTTLGDFMMRSQLDAYDPRLPGTGMFDLKTRAVVSIRMDAKDFHKGLGYEIRHRIGQWESFEREYFDMIRSAFLKYSLQVRMGRMDGIFVAFHNTERIFGFQYIPISEMDQSIHGQASTHLGDREFKLSLHLLNKVLDKATAEFPGQSLRLHIETRPSDTPFMYIFAKPVNREEIEEVQSTNRAAIEEFERNILGLGKDQPAIDEEPAEEDTASEQTIGEEETEEMSVADDIKDLDMENEDVWEGMRLRVEETMDNDALGATSVREAIEDALEQSGLLRARSLEESRRYVDALLEAIISVDPETASDSAEEKALLESVQEAVISEEAAAHGEAVHNGASTEIPSPATSIEGSELHSSVPGEKSEAIIDSSQVGAKAEEGEHSVEDQESPIQPVPSQSQAPLPAHVNLTLKDLIIKLAKQVEAASAEEKIRQGDSSAQDSAADLSKLRKFERILSEMMASSKAPEAAATEPDSPEPRGHQASKGRQQGQQTTEATDAETPPSSPTNTTSRRPDEKLLGMILTVRNKVNGQYVTRPENIAPQSSWIVEYAIQKIEPLRAHALYEACKTRRQKLLRPDEDKETEWSRMFQGKLETYSKKGRQFRAKENAVSRERPVKVYGFDKPLQWEEVFPGADKRSIGIQGGFEGVDEVLDFEEPEK